MMKFLKKALGCLFAVAILGLVIFIVAINQAYHFWWAKPTLVESPSIQVETEELTVEEGAGLSLIAQELADRELISSPFWFKVYTKLDGSARSVQAGVFELQSGMSYATIIDILGEGDSEEVVITIPEGYTLKQISEEVTSKLDITTTEWALMTGLASPLESHPFIIAADKPDHVDLEGYMFPDTYHFFANATAEEVATKLLEEMEANVEVAGISDNLSEAVPTIHDALTLASIVEREVRSPDDMATVAGLFYNRLEIGMALQADSTVNYFTGKDTPSVSLSDTEIESLYNTYLHTGLPPGAISNPGLNALQAVADPVSTDYFYFLTSPEGDVYYATTFEEHIVNRSLYLR
jgi:UPF0755 protein